MSEQNRTTPQQPRDPNHRSQDTSARPRRKKRAGRSPWKTFLKVMGTLALIGVTTGALLCCFAAVYIQTAILPHTDLDLSDFFVGENSVMYYQDKATGQQKELVTLLSTTSTIWVDYEDLPKYLLDATVAIEDRRFYDHNGVDWIRTAKAVLNMMTGQNIQGGSTLTQQLIKNLTLYDDVTVKRKIIEIFRALEFDKTHTKEETLTWYLNVIFLGNKYKGVGSASFEYFGKPVSELSLAECASLISITNNPSIYSPYSNIQVLDEETGVVKTGLDFNKERQELVLKLMLDQEKISSSEYASAMAEELDFVRAVGEEDSTDIYTWYEEQVISDVRRDLMEKYDYSSDAANMLLSSGGLSIYTCVDPEIQAMAEQVYEDRGNLDFTSPSGEQSLQSAITIIDNQTGDVVAIVGRVGEKDKNLLRNFATDTLRPPGSSIKPLAVYAPALEMGLVTPYTVMDDYPYQVLGGKPWPVNVDGRYRGLVSVRAAVTDSFNTVSVRTLADLVTPRASFDFMQDRFHIPLVDATFVGDQVKSDIDLSPLALGGLTKGVNTRDMAEAYATFANNGVYKYSRTYSKVVGSDGRVILDNSPQEEAVLKQSTAYYMTDMLKNVVANGSGSAARLSGMTVAGKTGTTDSKFDRWFVGYTPYYTAAVWIGYEYNERVTAPGNPAVKMWQKVMSQVHDGLDNKSFSTPGGMTSITYCMDSGMIATDFCRADPRGSRAASGSVFRDDAPGGFCTFHSEQSTVVVCVDSPILDAKGAETSLYHLAGDFCPEVSRKSVTMSDYLRTPIGNASTEDGRFNLSFVQGAGPCTVHVTAPEPEPLPPTDPWDPTWPWDPTNPDSPNPPDPDGSTPNPDGSTSTPGGSTSIPGVIPDGITGGGDSQLPPGY